MNHNIDTTSKKKPRNKTLDIMKGLGVLLIFIDHCDLIPLEFRRISMSFLMPMFFIVGGYLYRPSDNILHDIIKSFKRLVLPYIAGVVILSLIHIFVWRNCSWLDGLKMLVSAAGVDNFCCRYLNRWESVGAFWFFMAMFWCRLFFNFIYVKSGRYKYVALTGVAVAGYILLRYIIRLPLGILEGMSMMMFYLIGHLYAKYVKKQNIWTFIVGLVAILVWLWDIKHSEIICSAGLYRHHILNIIGACGATYIYSLLCKGIAAELPKLTSFLTFAGHGSLFLIWIHKLSLHYIFTANGVWGYYPHSITAAYIVFYVCLQWAVCLALLLIITQSSALSNFFGIYIPQRGQES